MLRSVSPGLLRTLPNIHIRNKPTFQRQWNLLSSVWASFRALRLLYGSINAGREIHVSSGKGEVLSTTGVSGSLRPWKERSYPFTDLHIFSLESKLPGDLSVVFKDSIPGHPRQRRLPPAGPGFWDRHRHAATSPTHGLGLETDTGPLVSSISFPKSESLSLSFSFFSKWKLWSYKI